MSSHNVFEGSALSNARCKPLRCGSCYKMYTEHLVRHFERKHPGEQPSVASWVSGDKYIIVPYKKKGSAPKVIIVEQSNDN